MELITNLIDKEVEIFLSYSLYGSNIDDFVKESFVCYKKHNFGYYIKEDDYEIYLIRLDSKLYHIEIVKNKNLFPIEDETFFIILNENKFEKVVPVEIVKKIEQKIENYNIKHNIITSKNENIEYVSFLKVIKNKKNLKYISVEIKKHMQL